MLLTCFQLRILTLNLELRMCFFKKIQDWIFKSERIRKPILRFFTRQNNPRSFRSWCVKGTEESSLEVDSSVPLRHHDPRDLGLICLVKNRKIGRFFLNLTVPQNTVKYLTLAGFRGRELYGNRNPVKKSNLRQLRFPSLYAHKHFIETVT